MSVTKHTVERYYIPGFSVNKADRFVKASDYDALVKVCRELIDGLECTCYRIRGRCYNCTVIDKALALMDGEKNEGVR